MKNTRSFVFASLCLALAVALPQALHGVPQAGQVVLPMHLPVLLAGLLCGPWLGLAVGLWAPLLSHLLFGMPPSFILLPMALELAVYGLVAGLLIRLVRTDSRLLNIFIALIGAMLLGRVVYGLATALFFKPGQYSLTVWATSLFVTGLPGIALQLVAIPALMMVLDKAGLTQGLK